MPRRPHLAGRWMALAGWLAIPSGAAAQDVLPAEGIVAVVGGPTPGPTTDVVLLSDVELRAHLELAVASGTVARDVPTDLLAATLEEIMGELLVAREADRLGTPEPSEGDVLRERERLVTSVGGATAMEALLSRVGASDDELDAIATRRARVNAFFRANLEGTSDISDAQVEARYATGLHQFGERPLEEIREPLRAWIAAEAVRNDVGRWLEVLRDRTVVRVLWPALARRDRVEPAPAPE